ncbi:CoxG family protein [Sphingosinicella microcystinivorans]|uniref:Carbon monoxide dehydrogenase n=1 Tax=Sphingosinicella microcystinivorans TaxID=335406 RepID=A0AAD1DAW0_SPHMI|nr:carbon monoxide dehydrogenase subunit G [Sphingosinicella microcystinivorans]RKS86299.1 hypothetical protein DFR51_3001 [Sphingosinicella microcystinivorans]BBE35656.1 carbon monoxide dehydrogenase [Sphingosinicella microcystinivorans]
MDIRGDYLLPCSIDRAWEALNDPEMLKASLKGCEVLERIDDHSFKGTVSAKIGPVSARFSGTMVQSELDPPRSCRMTFEGQGGVAGFAKGGALVTLTPEDGGTRLAYDASAQVGGKLAQMGARLIEGTARSMADDFFAKFAAAVALQESAAPAAPVVAASPEPMAGDGKHVWLIIAAIIAVIAVIVGIWL